MVHMVYVIIRVAIRATDATLGAICVVFRFGSNGFAPGPPNPDKQQIQNHKDGIYGIYGIYIYIYIYI